MPDPTKLEELPLEALLQELRSRETKAGNVSAKAEGAAGVVPPAVSGALAQFDDASIAAVVQGKQKGIYGTDNRIDVFQLASGPNLDDVDSVVALFESSAVIDNGNGTSSLQTQTFGTARNLCASERFRDQPIGAFCSGFLVAPRVIATAGHCVNAGNVTSIRFVFGFRMSTATAAVTTIKNSEIYRGASIIGRREEGDGPDWALVLLDRAVTNHRIARIRRVGKTADAQAVHVIGHPVGLPAKFADGATVRNNSPSAFFVANLDTYGGNSGSPVFNSITHEIEGVLVRGETDFVTSGGCNISLVCPTTGCRGEDCTRTTEFAKLVCTTSIWPNGKAYFFKGSQYQRYDLATDKVDAGYPKPIQGNWPGFPASFAAGIDAYALWTNGKAYFFKGDGYIRYDLATDTVDAGYPKPVAGNWPGVFTSNINAAAVWTNGKAYFFKGSQYQRYDLATDKVDAGYPKPIQGNWPGFPASFAAGIDAVAMWPNGKAYFFKGSEYIRYDVSTDKVDAGYPKPISASWPGLFTGNLDA